MRRWKPITDFTLAFDLAYFDQLHYIWYTMLPSATMPDVKAEARCRWIGTVISCSEN